ncbi:hypothetical protein DFW101_3485 [Solidesulfovibrio carbinoliphilus subsp. oakridgensis]|uniref:Uncharacterized protein n=1 Tax=Solidesulfovibrio carbinoliphilus subsp. oakridgensis TaxID=694327 RepID=G7QC37_9BACT|nr:hypothetical protein [Solidesulfovibrio carbinoliphilus]EHJ49483.1 hypothetical protein DFW101_3485 [Solidesulfovibrio carbinoliphilus subsp. oakridgensis]
MYRDKLTGQYPLSKQELVARNPNISLPAAWDDSVLDLLGVGYVKPVAWPEITATQRLVEGEPEQREDGAWYQTWTVQDFTPEEVAEALARAKGAKIAEARAACDAVLDPLGTEYGAWEKQTWDQQATEAAALMADPTLETNTSAGDKIPCIRSMAAARGMPVAELAQRILANREAWLQISGAVIGQRQAIYDRVQAATTAEEVATIDVTIALPG